MANLTLQSVWMGEPTIVSMFAGARWGCPYIGTQPQPPKGLDAWEHSSPSGMAKAAKDSKTLPPIIG